MTEVPEESEQEQTPEEMAAMAAAFNRMMAPAPAWRPACCNCANNHKLAIMELAGKLKVRGIEPGTEEFNLAMQGAMQAGALMAQNPMMVQGMNGDAADVIPPVREADLLVNGNSVCIVCFTPMKQTSLLQAGPGGGLIR